MEEHRKGREDRDHIIGRVEISGLVNGTKDRRWSSRGDIVEVLESGLVQR